MSHSGMDASHLLRQYASLTSTILALLPIENEVKQQSKEIKTLEQELETTKKGLAASIRELETIKEAQQASPLTKSGGLFKTRSCNDVVKEEALKEAEANHIKLLRSLTEIKQRLKHAKRIHDRLVLPPQTQHHHHHHHSRKESNPASAISPAVPTTTATYRDLATLRKTLQTVIAKLFYLMPSTEETHFSKTLNTLTNEFHEAHKQSNNLRTALRNIQRGIRLLKTDNGVVLSSNKDVDVVAMQDIMFALHFLQLAHAYWPNLRNIELPKSVETGGTSSSSTCSSSSNGKGSQRENWALATQRLKILKAHLDETQDFLKKEQLANVNTLNSVFSRGMDVSETLRLLRFKMLEARLAAASLNVTDMAERRAVSDTHWCRLLDVDIDQMKKIAMLEVIATSPEEIGSCLGQIYVSSEIEREFGLLIKESAPRECAVGIKFEPFTIVVEPPAEDSPGPSPKGSMSSRIASREELPST
ncbi:hypothetical protein BDR26DRAFT_1004255 [Obelidium mucronatum]|nr:hypothetical protein BDR26DRAFT_1004255 [Obelidium mucronatum]